MDLLSFFSGLNWEFIKNKLLSMWVDPSKLQWVDFSNIQQMNKLAEDIMPWLIKSNPNIANVIKQNSSMLPKDKQEEVIEIIDAQ